MGYLALEPNLLGLLCALLILGSQLFPDASGTTETVEPIQYSPWDLVTALAWSPDGDILAVSAGTTIHLYYVNTGEEFYSNNLGVYSHSLAFSPAGDWLAAGSRDGKIRLWLINKGDEGILVSSNSERSIQAHSRGVNALNFNWNGQWLVSGGNDAMARLWDVQTGALLSEIIGGTFTVPAVEFLNQSDQLAVVNGIDVRLRDPLSRSISGSFKAEQATYSLAVCPEDQLLAVGDTENGVQVWKLSQAFRSGMDNYPEPVWKASHHGKATTYQTLIWKVAFSPDGQILASAGGDGYVVLWSATDGQRLQVFAGHQAAVTSLAFSPDGDWMATGGLDASVRFWRIR